MGSKENDLKRGQLYWLILKVIGIGIVSGGGHPLRPTLPLMIKSIIQIIKVIRNLDVEEDKIRKTLDKLEKKEIITIMEKGEQVFIQLKDEKNPYVIKYSIKTLLDFKKKKKKWDGKWFLVFFDVPEMQRNKRNYLRKFLLQIGFYRYQKSVYLFPYECEAEINLIKKIVESGKYMKYIIADKIEDEILAKTYFNL